jgi:multisubunit Na+/H+ antiporter MnhF subunit
MLNRFGLVIHWLGFIGSVGFTGYVLWRLLIYFDQFLISDLWIIVLGVIGPLGSVWVIRFILTGHKGLMPWSKAKQPASPEN